MGSNKAPKNLEQLLQRLEEAAEEDDKVTLDQMMDHVGRRSFGPLLLLAGTIIFAPVISDIPGVSTLMGLFILFVAVQVLLGKKSFWLPKWLLKRSVSSSKLKKAIDKWLMRPAKFVDRFLGRRLEVLTGNAGMYAIAVISVLLGIASPLTEVVPFSGHGMGAAVMLFGLALIAHDGVLALGGFLMVAGTVVFAFMQGS